MYLDFMSDKHLIDCIARLYAAFDAAYQKMTPAQFSSNKIDVISMLTVGMFSGLSEQELIAAETVRQAEKTFGNAIGTFHEELMGGLPGLHNYPVGCGYDLKSDDNTVFAEVKNKHNTMNSGAAKSVFERLCGFADRYPGSTAYLVQVIAARSCDEIWTCSGRTHPRVRRVSADRFYAKMTGVPDAFAQLYRVLPEAIDDYMDARGLARRHSGALGPYAELERRARLSRKSVIDLLAKETFAGYRGF